MHKKEGGQGGDNLKIQVYTTTIETQLLPQESLFVVNQAFCIVTSEIFNAF